MTDAIPPDVRAEIERRLALIESEKDVRILFAVESGSRAWGFPSPDSDYDVRFVYVHAPDWYLSVDQRRDVIELPIEDELDFAGWELRKALKLLIKPNPVLLEWLRSPIVYRADPSAMAQLARLGERTAHQRPSRHHYLGLAQSQYRRFIAGKEEVKLKKYFYVLRPALALMWLRKWPDLPVPMALPELRARLDLSNEVSTFLDMLLEKKRKIRELGSAPRVSAIDSLIEDEISRADAIDDALSEGADVLLDKANQLFRNIVKGD